MTGSRQARPPVVEPIGPGGVIWYAAGDQRALLLAVRLLLHQVAHPMIGAAVEQQSVYKDDPYGRLWRTTRSVVRSVYGGRAAADEGQRLLRMHAGIRGVDAAGRGYHASTRAPMRGCTGRRTRGRGCSCATSARV